MRCIAQKQLQPRTKPVETNRENAYFFLSSRQKLKPPPNECPISPSPYPKLFRIAWQLYTLVLDQGNFEQGVGRGFTFCVQGRREQGAKVRKQMELSQQFCSGLQHFYIFQIMLFFPVNFVYRFCQDHLKFFWYVTNIKVYERCENSSQSKDWRLFSAPVVVFVLFDKSDN